MLQNTTPNGPGTLNRAVRSAAAGAVLASALAGTQGAWAQGKAPSPEQIRAQAQAREAQAKTLLTRYTADPGREDTDGLLKEPAVRAELQRLVGGQLPTLMHNIFVRGSIDYFGGSLRVSGNAAHKGGEEEGVVCVTPYAPSLVEAAIFSKGKVTVFATADKYEYLTVCVKDWITQVNSGHRDRIMQPQNVQVVRPK